MPLAPLTVVTGANGTGKSSTYRALRLLADAARGGIVAALAGEGGLSSVLWAGPSGGAAAQRAAIRDQDGPREGPAAVRLGFASEHVSYALDVGLPAADGTTLFRLDPVIRREVIWSGQRLRPSALLIDRSDQVVRVRDADGGWRDHEHVDPGETVLSELADAERAPEVLSLREEVRSWRFYDAPRTDAQAPARAPQLGTLTPVLAGDGHDLAAALQTIREIGADGAVEAALDDAFPGSRVEVRSVDGWFHLRLHQPGLRRPLSSAELSDGTLRYLLWTAALLTPRPPRLMILNEPETSLHPDLLEPLAGLIIGLARRTQVIVVSHSSRLTEALGAGADDHRHVELHKDDGETLVRGARRVTEHEPWIWPAR